jgi:hypothetical protein
LAAASLGPLPAAASGAPIGPNELYRPLINKSAGLTSPVVVQMACFGAIRPGQTGHPMAGQTISVLRATASGPLIGKTGAHANSIGAFFGSLPPAAAVPRADTSNVIFTHFGTRAMPTSLVLPCAGKATVTFISIPLEPSTSVGIAVSFVGQP